NSRSSLSDPLPQFDGASPRTPRRSSSTNSDSQRPDPRVIVPNPLTRSLQGRDEIVDKPPDYTDNRIPEPLHNRHQRIQHTGVGDRLTNIKRHIVLDTLPRRPKALLNIVAGIKKLTEILARAVLHDRENIFNTDSPIRDHLVHLFNGHTQVGRQALKDWDAGIGKLQQLLPVNLPVVNHLRQRTIDPLQVRTSPTNTDQRLARSGGDSVQLAALNTGVGESLRRRRIIRVIDGRVARNPGDTPHRVGCSLGTAMQASQTAGHSIDIKSRLEATLERHTDTGDSGSTRSSSTHLEGSGHSGGDTFTDVLANLVNPGDLPIQILPELSRRGGNADVSDAEFDCARTESTTCHTFGSFRSTQDPLCDTESDAVLFG